MSAPVALLVLLSAEAAAPQLAAPGLTSAPEERQLAAFANERLAEELEARGVTVTTAAQVAAILSVERQRQLLGCSDTSEECLAELSNALGARHLLVGRLTRIGGALEVDLKVVSAASGKRVTGTAFRVVHEVDLPRALQKAAAAIAKDLVVPVSLGVRFWVPVGLGAAVAGTGGVLLGVGAAGEARLGTPLGVGERALTVEEGRLAAKDAVAKRDAGITLLAVGAAGVVTGVVLQRALGQPAPSVALAPTKGGGVLVIGGTFP